MGRYRKIDTRIWNDEKFRAVSHDAKLLFLFVLTHPHMTSLGAMRATPAGLADELTWSPERLRSALAEVTAAGFLEVNERACFVAAPKFLKYNRPESPNVVTSWGRVLEQIPECDERQALLQRTAEAVVDLETKFQESLPEPFAKAFERLRKAFPTPEPFPEQEPLPEQEGEGRARGPAPGKPVWFSSVPEDFKPEPKGTERVAAEEGLDEATVQYELRKFRGRDLPRRVRGVEGLNSAWLGFLKKTLSVTGSTRSAAPKSENLADQVATLRKSSRAHSADKTGGRRAVES